MMIATDSFDDNRIRRFEVKRLDSESTFNSNYRIKLFELEWN